MPRYEDSANRRVTSGIEEIQQKSIILVSWKPFTKFGFFFKLKKIIKFLSDAVPNGLREENSSKRSKKKIKNLFDISIFYPHSLSILLPTQCCYHIFLFLLHIFPIFLEIPLAQSRSLIKTTINGKSLQFAKIKRREINFLKIWGLRNERPENFPNKTPLRPDQSEITVKCY